MQLKICVSYLFGEKCWNVFTLSWSGTIFYYQYSPGGYAPPIAHDGSFSMEIADSSLLYLASGKFNYYSLFLFIHFSLYNIYILFLFDLSFNMT